MKITVVGSGGWGTALALVLEENGHDVTLWSHRPEKAEELKRTRENPMLRGVRLPESLHLTADLNAAGESDVVVMVTPSYAVRETAAKLDIQWELDSQADITVSFLKSCGIPAFLNGSLGKVLGGFASQGVEIWVPASRLEEAQALLDAPAEETSPEQD